MSIIQNAGGDLLLGEFTIVSCDACVPAGKDAEPMLAHLKGFAESPDSPEVFSTRSSFYVADFDAPVDRAQCIWCNEITKPEKNAAVEI